MRPPAPDFVIAGAPKCGTTALYETLKTHPGVFLPRVKEPHYFAFENGAARFSTSKKSYLALFARAPEHQLRGEASTGYLRSKSALPAILKHRPDIKVIAVVRDPIEGFISFHNQLLQGLAEDQPAAEQAWHLQSARAQGRQIPWLCRIPRSLQYKEVYSNGKHVQRMFEIVPPEQRLVLIYEDMRDRPEETYSRLISFLGLEHDGRTTFVRANSFFRYRPAALAYVIALYSRTGPLRRWVAPVHSWLHDRGIAPLDWATRQGTIAAAKPQLSEQFQLELIEAFRPDVQLLEKVLNRDLSAWFRAWEARLAGCRAVTGEALHASSAVAG